MVQLIVSDRKGKIFGLPAFGAVGMEAGKFFRIDQHDLIKLPPASSLFMLPARRPVGYDPKTGNFTGIEGYFAVAAFTPPGFTITYNASYEEISRPRALPLFSYGACAFYKGDIYVTAVRIDRDRRHDCRFIDLNLVRKNVREFKKLFSANRLVRHLERCALIYGCPNAQNFFLSRYEAPLPISPSCNAACAGCISYQSGKSCPPTQPRIKFVPTPEEVSEIALFHIKWTKDPIVSFGQGCEGEPLLAWGVVERSIRLIRKSTAKGVINMNTNGSKPDAVRKLFDAGMDSVRISMNSAQPLYYKRYYRPGGYDFNDMLSSIKAAKKQGGFVSINYLVMPGFTDSEREFTAFRRLIADYHVDMIQWRNLNFDPLLYFKEMKTAADTKPLGMRSVIDLLRREFPHLAMGYFNSRAAASPRRQRPGLWNG